MQAIPTSKQFKRAAKIVRLIADKGFEPYRFMRVYVSGMSKRRLMNPFCLINYYWGDRELDAWESMIARHNEKNKHKTHRKFTVGLDRRQKKYRSVADALEVRAELSKSMDLIKDRLKLIYGALPPGKFAYIYDMAIFSIIPDTKERHRKLVSLFCGKVTQHDTIIVNILWDLSKEKSLRMTSKNITDKYYNQK